jgi:hypothetical protein
MPDHDPQRVPIIIGSDHAAYLLKERVKSFLVEKGFAVEDVGAFSEASVDYPDVGIKVASQVSQANFPKAYCFAERAWVCPWWPTNFATFVPPSARNRLRQP